MIKYPKEKKNAEQAAKAPAQATNGTPVEPFTYKSKPEVDHLVDSFLKDKGPHYQARIDATDKEFFVRKWVLAQAQKNEERNGYYASVERTLNQPEHAEFKEKLEAKYARQRGTDEQKHRRMLKEAGQRFATEGIKLVEAPKEAVTPPKQAVPPPRPKMTP